MPRIDSHPPVGFHFSVEIEGITSEHQGVPDIGFQEITGIGADVGMEEYREGGENRFAHRLANPVSYANLVMKRGMLMNSQVIRWFQQEVESFQFKTYGLTVYLLDHNHAPLEAWNFIQAWPLKWSVEGLNAQNNGLMIESIEFCYQYYKRLL